MMSLRYSAIINLVGEAIVLVSVDVALETLTSMASIGQVQCEEEGEHRLAPSSTRAA
jgi:hypothetical protein